MKWFGSPRMPHDARSKPTRRKENRGRKQEGDIRYPQSPPMDRVSLWKNPNFCFNGLFVGTKEIVTRYRNRVEKEGFR